MKIVKVLSTSVMEFQQNNAYILLQIGEQYNYYLVQDSVYGYEVMERIPDLGGIVHGTLEGIIDHVTYLSNEQLREEILETQIKLNESDYKVLKMYEYSMAGKERPYDIMQVHTERQTLRDKVNSLQCQIKNKKTWEELGNIIVDRRK